MLGPRSHKFWHAQCTVGAWFCNDNKNKYKLNIISYSRHKQVRLMRLRYERYISHHRKSSLMKHTCSWRDKLNLLWTPTRQVKIFLRKYKLIWNMIQASKETFKHFVISNFEQEIEINLIDTTNSFFLSFTKRSNKNISTTKIYSYYGR